MICARCAVLSQALGLGYDDRHSAPIPYAMFIVLEGLDGAGTTTQLGLLAESLTAAGHRVTTTREPSDGPIGVRIREALRGELTRAGGERLEPESMALLFAADRINHLSDVVTPALERGEWVLSDRYVHSSIAYQGAENDLDWVVAINSRARAADLVIFVEVPVDVCLTRIDGRGKREMYEQRAILEQVAAGYAQAFAMRADPWVRVDGTGTIEETRALIWACVAERLAD